MAEIKNDGRSAVFTNPLDKFRSHSIHYIMLACRTTEQAKEFMNTENNAATLEAISKVQHLGDAVPYGMNNNTAFLVMDTRRFTQFSIDNLEYEIFINGLENNSNPGNFATTLKMSVLDTIGISFVNFMQWMMNEKMQCNYDGMIFMLRVLFVGQDENDHISTVQSITIPMHLIKMNLDLTFARGQYDLEFMPNMNFDTVRNSRWTQIATSTTYSTPKGSNKLGDIIDSFESTLNNSSQDYFKRARGLLKDAGREDRGGKSGFGRLVQYQFTIPTQWRDFEYAGASTGNATETIFAQMSDSSKQMRVDKFRGGNIAKLGQVTDSKLSVTAGTTITEVLDTILKQTPDIAKLGMSQFKQGEGGSVTFYKHLVGITSTDEQVTVHVDVIPFEVPNVVVEDSAGANSISQGDEKFYQIVDGKRVPKNYFEYDYIYTGRNIDILDFDMKFENLQWMLASNLDLGASAFTGVSELDTSSKSGTSTPGSKDGSVNKVSELMTARAYDPLLPPLNTASEFDNFSQYSSMLPRDKESNVIKATQDYTRNLAMFYACAPIIANMKIRGNPDIMAKFNMPSMLPTGAQASVPGSRSTASRAAYRKSLEQEIINKEEQTGQHKVGPSGPNGALTITPLGTGTYVTSPVFVKVNIKGPNVEPHTAETKGGDFAADILPDAYFVVMKLKNTIEGGQFTQDLTLYSHNIFGNGKITQPTPNAK